MKVPNFEVLLFSLPHLPCSFMLKPLHPEHRGIRASTVHLFPKVFVREASGVNGFATRPGRWEKVSLEGCCWVRLLEANPKCQESRSSLRNNCNHMKRCCLQTCIYIYIYVEIWLYTYIYIYKERERELYLFWEESVSFRGLAHVLNYVVLTSPIHPTSPPPSPYRPQLCNV